MIPFLSPLLGQCNVCVSIFVGGVCILCKVSTWVYPARAHARYIQLSYMGIAKFEIAQWDQNLDLWDQVYSPHLAMKLLKFFQIWYCTVFTVHTCTLKILVVCCYGDTYPLVTMHLLRFKCSVWPCKVHDQSRNLRLVPLRYHSEIFFSTGGMHMYLSKQKSRS